MTIKSMPKKESAQIKNPKKKCGNGSFVKMGNQKGNDPASDGSGETVIEYRCKED